MKNSIFLFMIILALLYKLLNIETFTNFKKYCNKFIFKDKFKKRYFESTDIFGFNKSLKNQIKKNKIYKNSRIKNCPIPLDILTVAKFIKSNRFHYIIDTRSKEKFKEDNIKNSINISELKNNLNKINFLDEISREDYILVIGDNIQFYEASKLKEIGKFNNVYYSKSGNYNYIKYYLKRIKKKNLDKCIGNFRYKSLCI